eukprot:6214149-Pleurochrysis_carterae.AAC.4
MEQSIESYFNIKFHLDFRNSEPCPKQISGQRQSRICAIPRMNASVTLYSHLPRKHMLSICKFIIVYHSVEA